MRTTVFAVLLCVFLVGMLTLHSGVGVVSAFSMYYLHFRIVATPEFPSTHDDVSVKVDFETPYIYLIPANFSTLSRSGNNFSIVVEVYPIENDIPATGYEEENYGLGALSEGLYRFNVNVQVWSAPPGELLRELLESTTYVYTFPVEALTITVPDDFPTIQEAVNYATDGDTIIVRNGTYDEYVNVTRSLRILGESVHSTMVIGFEIHANNVTISNFTMNAGSYSGVAIFNSSSCRITNNIVFSDFYPIGLEYSSNNFIANNRIQYSVNGWGITLMIGCNNNTIHQNSISQQEVGIYILDSHNNTLSCNELSNNYISIYIDGSFNHAYHNNFLNNPGGVSNLGENTWDNGCTGNYWSDYTERYPNASFDIWGIGDTPFVIDEGNQDNFPLMNVFWNPCDTDHDLNVDIFDIVKVCHFYGVPYWNDDCRHVDLAEPYGEIDIFDIVTIAMCYGEEYTP